MMTGPESVKNLEQKNSMESDVQRFQQLSSEDLALLGDNVAMKISPDDMAVLQGNTRPDPKPSSNIDSKNTINFNDTVESAARKMGGIIDRNGIVNVRGQNFIPYDGPGGKDMVQVRNYNPSLSTNLSVNGRPVMKQINGWYK